MGQGHQETPLGLVSSICAVYKCVSAGVCVRTARTMRCTDKGEHDSALPLLLMNDPTFVLVTGKNLEGHATAPNNAALVCLSATQALVGSYWETVTLETEHSKNSQTG